MLYSPAIRGRTNNSNDYTKQNPIFQARKSRPIFKQHEVDKGPLQAAEQSPGSRPDGQGA